MLLKSMHVDVDTSKICLVLLSGADISYFRVAEPILNKHFGNVILRTSQGVNTPAHLVSLIKKHKVTHILSSDLSLLKMLKPSLSGTATDNYGMKLYLSGLPFIFVPQFKQLYTVKSGNFILSRYVKKLLGGYKDFLVKDDFTWRYLTPENFKTMYKLFSKASLIAVDIETGQADYRIIRCCSYTALVGDRTYTVVIQIDDSTIHWAHDLLKAFNQLPAPKVMQNGMYDSAYFLRFNAPLRNYIFDTYHMMHCMYPELKKDLAFISSFFLDNFVYWKDESSKDLHEYNAKDTHNTLWVFLAQLLHMRYEAPWARKNFIIEMPMVFPALACELEGIAVNEEEMSRLATEATKDADTALASVQHLLGLPDFNPGSSQQVKALINSFAARYKTTFPSADRTNLQQFLELDPVLHERIVKPIREYRQRTKAVSTYFNPEKLLNGRFHYKLDPAGTETGRCASSGSAFWCGQNIQNIPPYAKSQYHADEGYELFEVDKSQAESWCTGYLSRDKNLLEVLHTSPDFHCSNASLFFGIPFDQLFDTSTGTKLNKAIRDVAKRTNHGANYNMGAYVLWITMGTAALLEAARLLGYATGLGPIEIAERLLLAFDRAYPSIRDKRTGYYARIIKEVNNTGMLAGPTGWTRRTFLNPRRSKPELNTLCAHPSQSLSALLVNIAWKEIFWELQVKKYAGLLRLKAQIHDSLFGQVKKRHKYIVEEIEQRMRVPVTIHGQEMVIPGDTGPVGHRWIDIKD